MRDKAGLSKLRVLDKQLHSLGIPDKDKRVRVHCNKIEREKVLF